MLKNSVSIVLFVIVSLLISVGSSPNVSAEIFKSGDIRFVKYIPWRCFSDKLFSFSKLDSNRKDVIVRCDCHKHRRKFNCSASRSKIVSSVACWRDFINGNGGIIYYEYYRSGTGRREGIWKESFFSRRSPNAKVCKARYKQIHKEFDRLKQKKKKK